MRRRWRLGVLAAIVTFAAQVTMNSTAAGDLVQHVVFEPLTSGDSALNVGPESATAALQTLKSKINAQSIFDACIDTVDPRPRCSPNAATVLVHGKIVPALNAAKQIESVTVRFQSYVLADAQTGSLDLHIAVKTPSTKLDDKDLDKKLAGILTDGADAVTVATLEPLIGTPQIQNGAVHLAIAPAIYQQFIQLIPASSDDAPYAGTLTELLSRRHIQGLLSSAFVGVATSGSATNASFCGLGQRYLVYHVSSKTDERRLIGRTRLQITASGQFFDCVDPVGSPYTVGAVDVLSIPTTGLAFPKMFGLLSILFISKTNSWTNVGNAGAAISNLVDEPTPGAAVANASEQILQQLVDNLCVAFKTYSRKPLQPQTRNSQTIVDIRPGGVARTKPTEPSSTNGSRTTTTTGNTPLPPIDFGNFTGPDPYPLQCRDAHLRVPPAADTEDTPLLDRNKVRPTPIPTNTVEP
jgi:hypothetical protein